MSKKFVVAGVAALSVLGLAAGVGSTASNTMPAGGVQGYGQVVSTGATVTAVTSNPVSTDASKLDSVVFSTSTDIRTKDTKLTLKNGSTVVGDVVNCVEGTETASPWTITCTVAAQPLFSAFDTTGLTVL